MTHLGFELSASKWEITKCESSHLQTIPFMDLIFTFLRILEKKIFVTSHTIGVHLVLFQFSPQVPAAPPRQFIDNPKSGSSFASHLKSEQKSLTCSSNAATLSPSPCCFSSFSFATASFLRKGFFSSLLCEYNNQI